MIKLRFVKYSTIGIFYIAAIGVVFCSKEPLHAPAGVLDWEMKITGLTATYDVETNLVTLTWDKPQWYIRGQKFDFYRLYRAPLSQSGGIDSSQIAYSKEKPVIDTSSTYFTDAPGLSNSIYYYGLKAVRIVGTDTVEGALSEMVPVMIGSGTSFNINNGDVYTVTPKSKLIVYSFRSKGNRELVKVRFTQKTKRFLKKGSVILQADDLFTIEQRPSNKRLQELMGLTGRKDTMIASFGKLVSGVETFVVADFDAFDGQNEISGKYQEVSEGINSYDWVLQKGNGKKRVYAEFIYNTGPADTVSDDIDIQPYRIKISILNDMRTSERTMRMVMADDNRIGGRLIPYYFIYKPIIQFSVSIFADTTIEEKFYYWVMTQRDGAGITFNPSSSEITYNDIDTRYPWIETLPKEGVLAGKGPLHDDRKMYDYLLDTNTEEGRRNISILRETLQAPQHEGQVSIFRLQGTELFNELAVAGSYWGKEPVVLNTNTGLFESKQRLFRGTASENFSIIKSLARKELVDVGYKEIYLILLFRGRFFEDVRTVIASYRNAEGIYEFRTFIDLYQPSINLWPNDETNRNPQWLTNGSKITSIFGYTLRPTGSVTDRGLAAIEEVSLIIARKPDSLVWNINPLNGESPADTIKVEQLYNYAYRIIPFEIKTRTNVLSKVSWENIDPRSWPPGKYIMGIITRDEYGNEGFAPARKISEARDAPYPNPWVVEVLATQ